MIELGKVPPQAIELEEAVLGAVLLEKEAITVVGDKLIPEHFYKEANKEIWKAILSLSFKNEPIDILTVTNYLRKAGTLDMVGGAYYVTTLTDKVNSASNIEHHARIVIEMSIKRQLIEMAGQVSNLAYEDTSDCFDILGQVEHRTSEIASKSFMTDSQHILKPYKDYMFKIETLMGSTNKITGVSTGFPKLNQIIGGFQNTDLIIVAGRPGMGKTAFAISLLRNIGIEANKPAAFFSLEMSTEQLVARLVSGEADISTEYMRNGNIDIVEWGRVVKETSKIPSAPLYIDDTPSISIMELKTKARRLKAKHNIEIMFVDYLQMMQGYEYEKRNYNREQEVSSISRGLKGIAKELNIPVIAMASLSRACEARNDKRPKLSDLRESGSIESDADLVIFLYRDEYYGITQDANGNVIPAGTTEVIIEKHRSGRTGRTYLIFQDKYTKFIENEPAF
jgi:replicative DNA helicase